MKAVIPHLVQLFFQVFEADFEGFEKKITL